MKNRLLILFAFALVFMMNACDDDEQMPPMATATPNEQTIDSGTASSIALTSDIAGTTFNWTVVQDGVDGATNGSGSTIEQTLTATGLEQGTVTYTVIPTNDGLAGSAITVVVTVNPPMITYVADVKSILVNSCAPCHVEGGGNPNKWDDYTSTKSKINVILDRVQRESTAQGFMPKGREKLPDTDIAILKKWMDDGLLEN